jgi:hypothetical protein
MKPLSFLIVAVLVAGLTANSHAKIERVVEKTFNVQSGGLLTVETQGGNIRVQTSTDHVVKVIATQTIKTTSESEADELLKKLTLTIQSESDGVTAKAAYEKRTPGFSWGSWPPVQVSFVVSIPVNYNVAIKTSGGDIVVGDLDGKVRARTSGGNVVLGKISGVIDANTSGGDVRLREGLSATKLGTSGGNISVDRLVGPADLDTSGGDIKMGTVENTVNASTSGGNVTADWIAALKGDCRLETSGGDVRVSVPRALGLSLDASTSGGQVHADGLTITIEKGGTGRSKLAGKVNGGGPVLKLHSSGGDISIATR